MKLWEKSQVRREREMRLGSGKASLIKWLLKWRSKPCKSHPSGEIGSVKKASSACTWPVRETARRPAWLLFKSKWRIVQMFWEKKPGSTGALWTVKKNLVLLANVRRKTWMQYVSPSCLYVTMKESCSWGKGSCVERNVLPFSACFCES